MTLPKRQVGETMLPEMTPAAARALQSAHVYAAAAGKAEREPVHLLRGLLEEEEGRAALLVVRAGLEPAFRSLGDFGSPSARPAAVGEDEVSLPLHESTRTVLLEARAIQRDLSGEAMVSSEALLLALVRHSTEALALLEGFGFRADKLEAVMRAELPPPLQLDEPLALAELTEQVDTLRILDACANRAREGLRVVEDYCRFVLEDAFLSGQLKQLRHDLAAALSELKPDDLLSARDTAGDVGTALSTQSEHERGSLTAVARANWKRLQEALRSLEEFGKLHGDDLGRALEQLRYRSYTLERALLLGAAARERLADASLYVLLSASGCSGSLEWTIAEAAAGGAQIIQLREKDLNDRDLLERATLVRQWTRRAGVLFIVNDRPDVARLVGADGVHLGQDDLPVREARRILGPEALIGVSTHDLDQVRQAILDGAGYLGVGPTFPSRTKEFPALAGLEFVRQASAETTLPLFVLGGVNANNVGAVIAAGGKRVAVGHAVAQAEDPRAIAAQLRFALAAVGGVP
jgi:thiamine-phosphate pyrophosphorylase